MKNIFISLGSNLENPRMQIEKSIAAMRVLPQTNLIKTSSLYQNAPMCSQDQPDFINAVAQLETTLTPTELLDHLNQIESDQGRVREGERWGSRTIDLDILLYGDEIIQTKRLTIPHYGLKERAFVLYPLAEIAPDLKLPSGESVVELAKGKQL